MKWSVICCLALLFTWTMVAGCRKNLNFGNSSNDTLSDDALGYYTTTELGSKLSYPLSFDSILIDGYTDKRSYLPGDSISWYLSGPHPGLQQVSITDVNGNKVMSFSINLQKQSINTPKPWENGFMYNKTVAQQLPSSLASGVYFLNLEPFVCRSTAPAHDLTVIYPTNTMNAYNSLGGKSLYNPDLDDRSTVVSFLRPLKYSPTNTGLGLLQWLTTQSYSVNYVADEDVEDYSQLASSKVVVIIGHSEYWTRAARKNIDKFVDAGGNLLVLSGNTMWWQVRYNRPKNLMICYKDNTLDPITDDIYKTIKWYTPQLGYPVIPSIGQDFVGGGYGEKLPGRWDGYKVLLPNSPLLRGTNLQYGQVLKVPTEEYDGAPLMTPLVSGDTAAPQLNHALLPFSKIELVGYDIAKKLLYDFPQGPPPGGSGTMIICKKTSSSGTIINVGSTDWCSALTFDSQGADGQSIKIVTKNMIDGLLGNGQLFSK